MAPKISPLFSFILLLVLPTLSHAAVTSDANGKKPLPFEFIKNLQGCHKGDKVKGIHHLKKYLENFGYLSYSHSNNQIHANDDDFDDLLESAVKTYQVNYHLKATGNLDAETVSMMMTPRCGVADIINGTTSMQSGKKRHHQYGPNSLHEVSHYSFFPRRQRWPLSRTHLTYGFLPSTPEAAKSPVARAFSRWDLATRFTFAQAQNYQNADMKIGFFRRDHQDGSPFDGAGGTIAHAFAPTDGRFHYDGDETFAVGATPGAFDLETVALHEIGHLLGLGHSSVQAAIMFPSIAAGATKGLHTDDIQGITALYSA